MREERAVSATIQAIPALGAPPTPRRWTKAEYYRLGEDGFFQDQRVELIEGEIIVHPRQTPLHADTVDRVGDFLRAAFGLGPRVRCRLPLDLGQTTEPE